MRSSAITRRGFRAFYREHFGFVRATVSRLGVSAALVDDATQDTFVVAYRRRAEFSASLARPWLYGIARGVASNYRRTAWRTRRKRRAIADASRSSLAQPSEIQGVLHALDHFLHELPERERELFMLSEVEGFTGPELAAALGGNPSTIYGRIRSLRRRFAQNDDNELLLRRAKERRPRATTQSWVALLPSLRAAKMGSWGLGSVVTSVVAAGLGATASAVVVGGMVVLSGPGRDGPSTYDAPTIGAVASAGSDSQAPEPAQPAAFPLDAPGLALLDGAEWSEPRGAIVDVVLSDRPSSASAEQSIRENESSGASPTAATRSADPKGTEPTPLEAAISQGDDLAQQNALLRRATRALADGDPTLALDAMREHARRFPDSRLSDLRTALRVEALCARGKRAQARGEARVYATAHPSATLRRRILGACPAQSASAGQE